MLGCIVVSAPQASHSSVNIYTLVPQVWGENDPCWPTCCYTQQACVFPSSSLVRLQVPFVIYLHQVNLSRAEEESRSSTARVFTRQSKVFMSADP